MRLGWFGSALYGGQVGSGANAPSHPVSHLLIDLDRVGYSGDGFPSKEVYQYLPSGQVVTVFELSEGNPLTEIPG